MNLALIERRLVVISEPVGVHVYDFDFELHFACTHPSWFDGEERCVLRVGAIENYQREYDEKLSLGLRLVNSPEEHRRASELEYWYPVLSDITPRTMVFETLPSAEEIEHHFNWPVFIKGSRQTSRHRVELSVVESEAQYERVVAHYRSDAILHWQKPVVREFIPLMPTAGGLPGQLPPSIEYRSFWWQGQCVGWGRYWHQVQPYDVPDAERGLAVARQAAQRLNVPFLVVDFAKTRDGRWIVIECNDAQESGYAAVSAQLLWRKVLDQLSA